MDTGLDHVDPNILNTGVDLLPDEIGGRLMDRVDTLRILSGQSRRRSHSIAAMRRYDFLVGFETPCALTVSVASGGSSFDSLTPRPSCPSPQLQGCASWLYVWWFLTSLLRTDDCNSKF